MRRFYYGRGAAAAVEFALVAPFLFALLYGIVEVARVLSYANAIEKGLRVGATYAARAPSLSADVQATIQNLVRTGTVDGSGAPVAPGWSDAAAELAIDQKADFVTGGENVAVFRLTARVPFQPMLPGFSVFTITRSHEQAYIGY